MVPSTREMMMISQRRKNGRKKEKVKEWTKDKLEMDLLSKSDFESGREKRKVKR